MKKICYVVTIPETIEAFFIPQLLYLSEHGFEVSVICSDSMTLKHKLSEAIRYYAIDIPRGVSIIRSFYAINELVKVFKKNKFDIIQYSTPNAALYASIAAKIVGCKIRNYHLMGFRYLGVSNLIGRLILKKIEKTTCNNSTSIECVSRSNLEFGINQKIFKECKATVVWNGSTGGVDFKKFNYAKRSEYRNEIRFKYGLNNDLFVYGFVGRITKDKGINELLVAFNKIKDFSSKLLIIGNPEGINSLDQNIYNESLRNSSIIYISSVNDIEKYFAALDVLVLPSYREGFGNVVIEAAAMGTPAIVSNIPGPIDAISLDNTAITVNPKNVDELYHAMIEIHNRNYLAMGENAHSFVQNNFDSDKLCDKILQRKITLLEGAY